MEWSDITMTNPCQPVLMTAFGDWFLEDDTGHIVLLSMLEGNPCPMADLLEDLNEMLPGGSRGHPRREEAGGSRGQRKPGTFSVSFADRKNVPQRIAHEPLSSA
jgi:hypothetical protein